MFRLVLLIYGDDTKKYVKIYVGQFKGFHDCKFDRK